MLPSISGLVSVHDLQTIFSGSTEWITIHQDPQSILDPEFKESAPFMEMSFQIVPGEPVETQLVGDPSTGQVRLVRLRRKGGDYIIKPH